MAKLAIDSASLGWYLFMSPCMLSLHLCFGRPLLRVPETSSLNDFAQMWFKCCHLKRWPNHFHDLFSWKVSMGVMCASFLVSSCLMWSYYRSFHDLFSWKVSMGVMRASFLMSSCLMWSYYRSFHVFLESINGCYVRLVPGVIMSDVVLPVATANFVLNTTNNILS